MTVCFFGRIKEFTGGEERYTSAMAEYTAIRELLDELCIHYGEPFEAFIRGNETCLLLVNGMGIKHTGGLDTPLKNSDRVEILPFVEAG